MHESIELPGRRWVGLVALAVGLAMLVVPVGALTAASRGELPGAAGVAVSVVATLVLVVVPLWGAARLLRQRFLVGSDAVALLLGERVVRELPYAGLSEVRPVVDPSVVDVTPEFTNAAIVLVGTSTAGRRTAIRVTRQQVTTLDPLVRALAPVVAARPELVRTELGRRLFAQYAARARP